MMASKAGHGNQGTGTEDWQILFANPQSPVLNIQSMFRRVGLALMALALLLSSVTVVFADDTATDDFESGDFSGGTGWLAPWQHSGTVDIVNFGDPQTGSWHMKMQSGNGVAYRDVDLSGLSGLELTVWAKAQSFEGGDYATLLVGPPGSLTEIQRWEDEVGDDDDDEEDDDHEAEDDNQYHLYSFELGAFDTSGTFRIQFESHMSSSDDYLYIDVVTISDGQPPEEDSLPAPSGTPSPSLIALDGEFDDWDGRANVTDPAGDAIKDRGDILAFYWGDNPDDTHTYWMVERPTAQTKLVRYSLHLDMNNNGDFDEAVDRIVEVFYQPGFFRSWVLVKVRKADSNQLISIDLLHDWGETIGEGGSRVEFGVHFDDMGFTFGSAFRMYVESNWDDRAPDTGDIQWSPMPILGFIGMGALLIGGGLGVWWFRLRRYEGKEVPRR